MLRVKLAARFIAVTVLFLILISLTACQADQVSTQIIPVASQTIPVTSPTPYPGKFWVDSLTDLGEISPYVLGANYGAFAELGAENLDDAKKSGITFLRWPGGHWGDLNDVRPVQVDYFVGISKNLMKAEPSISVRMPGGSPGQAAQLVQYVNIDMQYGVRYWSIGNEPNLFNPEFPDWSAERYAKEWREFALAMKAVDPKIVLYGPDINQFVGDAAGNPQEGNGREYLVKFLKVNGDLVDVVTVHRYPFPVNGKCQTCPGVTKEDLRDNTPEWDRIIPNLHALIVDTIGTDKPVGVTEFNLDYTNIVGTDTSPDSFYGAIWMADVLGRMIRQRPELLSVWLLKANTAGHGLLGSFDIRPTYQIYQIYKRFGNHLLVATSDEEYVSLFAAKRDDGALTLVFVNRGESTIRKSLLLTDGANFKLAEYYLFDKDHAKVESQPLPEFVNDGEVELPGESVSLFVLNP